jgi:hypothetical protein
MAAAFARQRATEAARSFSNFNFNFNFNAWGCWGCCGSS